MHHTSKSVHNNRKVLFQCTISSNMNRRVYSILCQQLNPLPSPCYAPRSICKTHKEIDFKFEGLSQFGISFPIQKLWKPISHDILESLRDARLISRARDTVQSILWTQHKGGLHKPRSDLSF